MLAQTYKGKRLDLQHYVGASVIDYKLTLIDYDCELIDLSEYDEVILNFQEKPHGTLLFTLSSNTSPAEISFGSLGEMIFSINYESMDLKEKPYFYEVFGIVGNEKELLSYGVYLLH